MSYISTSSLSRYRHFKIWSVSSFLVPFVLAAAYLLWGIALACLAVFVLSLAYHVSNETRFAKSDQVAGVILIGLNFSLGILAGVTSIYFLAALALAAFSLYFLWYGPHQDTYEVKHGLWHIACSLITVLCIISFVFRV